jgi:N-formylglutamate deformylase
MFKLDHPQKNPLFDFYPPLGTSFRGLLSIPHSGEIIPKEFRDFLFNDQQAFKQDLDYKVDQLVDIKRLQESGVAVIVANIHRICVDLNRAEENCVLFWKHNTQGRPIVSKTPDKSMESLFVENFHRPYFEMLKAILKDLEGKKKDLVSMIDLHSMPSTPTAYHLKQNPHQKKHRPDFCLSDRKGKTCRPDFISFFSDEFVNAGYETSLNEPYIGGYITEFVDHFRTNNIQIEINRRIYMDEQKHTLLPNEVSRLKLTLTSILIRGFERFDS